MLCTFLRNRQGEILKERGSRLVIALALRGDRSVVPSRRVLALCILFWLSRWVPSRFGLGLGLGWVVLDRCAGRGSSGSLTLLRLLGFGLAHVCCVGLPCLLADKGDKSREEKERTGGE